MDFRKPRTGRLFWLSFTGFCLAALCGTSRPASAQVRADWKEIWAGVLTEAKKEGKVIVFAPPGDLIRASLIQGFKKAFPDIDIEYSGGRSGEQATKLKAERDAGVYSADVFLGGSITAAEQLKPMRAQDPIKPALILPEVTDLKYWRGQRMEFSDAEETYNLVFVNQASVRAIYNLSEVKPDEVNELYKLLDPKWKGKIIINDPLPTGAGHAFFHWIWRALGPEKAADFYKKIHAQAGVLDRDQRRQVEWVAQGRYAILLAPSTVMDQLLRRGLKFGVVPHFDDLGGVIANSFGSLTFVNRAPHPNAAKVFMNWFLTKEGQTAWSEGMGHVSRRIDVSTDHLPPYLLPQPGIKYWHSYYEKELRRSEEETKILRDLFGR